MPKVAEPLPKAVARIKPAKAAHADPIARDSPALPLIGDEVAALAFAIHRAVTDPNLDIDKLSRLYDLHSQAVARRAERAFSKAFAEAQGEMEPIVRSADNEGKSSKYAPLEAIVEAITPITAKHGFAMSFQTRASDLDGHLKVLADLRHRDGHAVRYEYDIPLDSGLGSDGETRMSAPQTYGSTTSYARRYCLVMIWNIAVKHEPTMRDRDGETAADPAKITPEQVATIESLLKGKDTPPKRFCAYFKIKSVPDLPSGKFADALKAINKVGA